MAVEHSFDGTLIQVAFSGAITAADLASLMEWTLALESTLPQIPDRLVDLGPSSTLAIGFGDIANLARVRSAWSPRNPIRTAVVVHSAAQQGYARMFQTINDHPQVTVQLFETREAAEAWLRISPTSA